MKTWVVAVLGLLVGMAAVGCEVTLEQPGGYPHPAPRPDPHPYPPPSPPPRPAGRVTGTVTWHARGGLHSDAILDVELYEVRRTGEAGRRLGEATVRRVGRSPVSFSLTYDPRYVDWRLDYVVSARIRVHGDVVFENAGAYPVITKGRPYHVDILLERVGDEHPPHGGPPMVPRGPLTGTVTWPRRRPLPPGATLEVELWDADRIGQRGGRVARQELARLRRPPVSFNLAYDRRDIDPRRDYVVLARVLANGRVVLRTADTAGVITKGRPMQVEIDLRRVGDD